MELEFIIFLVLLAVYLICYVVFAARTGCFKKSVGISVALGLGAIILLNATNFLTGIRIPINWWTLGSGAAMGLPGVIALLLLRLIFI